MKKEMMIISIILFLLFLFYSLNNSEENFNYIIKDNNIICYNVKIPQKEINDFITFYADKVNAFYVGNNISDRKINQEKILIILCKDSFFEWQHATKLQKELKEKLGLLKINIFEAKFTEDYDAFAGAIYVWDYYLSGIIIRTLDKKLNKFYSIIGEYNHYLIQTNYKKQIGIENFPDFQVLNYLIDEGFTNYIMHYLYYFNKNNYGNFLYENSIYLDKEKSKAIYDWIKKLYVEKKLSENLMNFYFIDLLNPKKKIPKDFISFHAVFYYSYIHYFYGTDFLFEFLRYLYNNEYYSTDEIFGKFFNKSTKDILTELDEKIKN